MESAPSQWLIVKLILINLERNVDSHGPDDGGAGPGDGLINAVKSPLVEGLLEGDVDPRAVLLEVVPVVVDGALEDGPPALVVAVEESGFELDDVPAVGEAGGEAAESGNVDLQFEGGVEPGNDGVGLTAEREGGGLEAERVDATDLEDDVGGPNEDGGLVGARDAHGHVGGPAEENVDHKVGVGTPAVLFDFSVQTPEFDSVALLSGGHGGELGLSAARKERSDDLFHSLFIIINSALLEIFQIIT